MTSDDKRIRNKKISANPNHRINAIQFSRRMNFDLSAVPQTKKNSAAL
jgi:hypothetical protein